MDIIQLLEVLKPAKDVVTVQVVNQKDLMTPWIDLMKAVLPAAATAGVAWLAMNKSHRQSESNAKRQSEEFKLGIEQQVRSLKLSTQLATEVELKKENCKSVREACSQFLAVATDAYNRSREYKQLRIDYDASKKYGFDAELHKSYLSAADGVVVTSQKFTSCYILIFSYLDEEKDKEFVASIIRISDVYQNPDGSGTDIGAAVGECGRQLRFYISRKQDEIISLSESITI